MRASTMLLVLPASALALVTPKPDIVARALYPRQSATCTYTCPPQDAMGVKLTSSLNMGDLFCVYGGSQCAYDPNTGELDTSPAGECPPNAVGNGACTRRRAYRREDNFTAMIRRKVAREEAAESAKEVEKRALEDAPKVAGMETVSKREAQEGATPVVRRAGEALTNAALD